MKRRYMIPKSNNEPTGPGYDPNYLTMESVDDQFYASFSSDCEYQIDEQEWVSLPANTTTPVIDAGHYISFRKTFASGQSTSVGQFTFDKRCNLLGNCNSIIFGDNADTTWSLSRYDHVYEGMFKGCAVVSIYEEFLPIQTLASYCYRYMFQNCTYLTNTPRFFASNLPQYCYSYMFSGCTSLTVAYDLSISTVNGYSCEDMFNGCSSLVNMPKVEAMTLSNHCYRYMFQNCTSLKNVQDLPATTLQPYCYYGMFQGCTSLTEMPEMKATTLANSCCIQMFQNCIKLTTASLPATTLAAYCYQQMFNGCTSLVKVSGLPATTLVNYCYMAMFQSCTGLQTAPELPAKTLANYCYYMMFYGCSSLSYIKALFTHAPATTYTNRWVDGVASTGTFVKSSDATWNDTFGVSAIPTGWNVLTEGYEDNYMTIEALEDGLTAKLSLNACEYSTDAINWTSLESDTYTEPINTGEKIYFKGNITPVTNQGVGTFTINKRCNLKGNCNSLLFGDNAATNTSLIGKDSAFHYMFKNCSTIVSVSEDFLPSTDLANSCYMNMFQNCTSLTNTPKLPATTLYQYCYANMFSGCISLKTSIAFDLFNSSNMVTTAPWCCGYMFQGCTSLKTGRTPYCVSGLAINKTSNCFNSMFRGCSAMNHIDALFPASMRSSSCQYWVENVASRGDFSVLNVQSWTDDTNSLGVNGCPENWNILQYVELSDPNINM